MARKRRNRRRRGEKPFRDIDRDLTFEEIMEGLDSGWSVRVDHRENDRSARKAA